MQAKDMIQRIEELIPQLEDAATACRYNNQSMAVGEAITLIILLQCMLKDLECRKT